MQAARTLASSCRLPTAWAEAEPEVFPTAGDVAAFVRTGRYRWENDVEDVVANMQLMLRHACGVT